MTKDYCNLCKHRSKATDTDEKMCYYCTTLAEGGVEPTNFAAIDSKSPEVQTKNHIDKPPLGLTPRRIVDKARIREIFAAMNRYSKARTPIPIEWIDELEDIVGKYLYGELEDYPLSGE